MSIEVFALQRIEIGTEAAGAFADRTLPGDFADLPFQEGSAQLALNRDPLNPQVVQQWMDARSPVILGPRMASLTVTVPLAAVGAQATSPAYTSWALGILLKTAFGGADDSNANTTFTGGSAAAPEVTSATPFVAGGAIGWVDASGVYHLHEVDNISLLVVNLHQAFPGAPSNTNPARGATTFYLTEDPDTSLACVVEGKEQDNRWALVGGQLTAAPTFAFPLGEIPTVTFTITFADWVELSPAAITPATYGETEHVYTEGFLRIKQYDTGTSRTLYDAAQIDFELQGPIYVPVRSPSGTSPQNGGMTVYRWRRNRVTPIARMSMNIPHENNDWFDNRDALSDYHIEWQIGTSAAGKAILLTLPRAEVVNVQPVNQDGLAYQRVTFEATIDGATGTSANEQERSAMRIHFGA
jgi:hypothetical protein